MEKDNVLLYPFISFSPQNCSFPKKARMPQETCTRHILGEAVANDCMLCKSLHQMKWQYLKRKKHIQDITFQLSTILY